MELTRRHLAALLLLAENMYESVDLQLYVEAGDLCSHGFIESDGSLTEKGEKVVAYAVKKAGEV